MPLTGERLASRLVDAGLSPTELDAKASLFDRALGLLGAAEDSARAWWVPGRIEFLGKHTDYAGGPSLLCAVERGFALAAAPRADRVVSVSDATTGQTVQTTLGAEVTVRRDQWSNYPLTVCRRLARNFPGAHRGADMAFASDLPPAAGLSSSSALIVATFLALAHVNELELRADYREAIRNPEDLAGYLGAVENGSGFRSLAGDRGVGTQGGSEDHTAILCARAGAFVQYAFAPIRFERFVPVPNGYVFVIATSGVVAEKTGGALEAYNRAAERAAAALSMWRDKTGSGAATLAAAAAETPDADVRLLRMLASSNRELANRYVQFRAETEMVRAAGDALVAGDLDRLGKLVDFSQAGADFFLGNQVPETTGLAHSARELGAVAASAFGAGFGGSVYALVRAGEVEEFRNRWAERYAKQFPHRSSAATFFLSAAGPATTRL